MKVSPGSFVIEGGHVEHEELDEEETEMPALAEHFDRYEESDSEEDALDDGTGSQIGSAVRETGEEDDLENEEYDFGGEEFEESELLAEEAGEEEEEGDEEESEEPGVASRSRGGTPASGALRPPRTPWTPWCASAAWRRKNARAARSRAPCL